MMSSTTYSSYILNKLYFNCQQCNLQMMSYQNSNYLLSSIYNDIYLISTILTSTPKVIVWKITHFILKDHTQFYGQLTSILNTYWKCINSIPHHILHVCNTLQ